MASCTPTFATEAIPVDPAECGAACEGVTFKLDSITTSTDSAGNCSFSWTVTRDRANPKETKKFTGSQTLACPSEESVLFYCDDNGDCPAFKLKLICQ